MSGNEIFFYIINHDNDKVLKILDQGIDINSKDDRGNTLLSTALHVENYEVANWVLDRGADFNIVDEFGDAPIVTDLLKNNILIANRLLEMGVKATTIDSHGMPIIIFALNSGNVEFVLKLLSLGADPNSKSLNGKSLIVMALENEHTDVVFKLLEMGVDPNTKDIRSGDSLIVIAVRHNNISVLNKLLEMNIDPNTKDRLDNPIITIATEYNNTDIVLRLLRENVDPETKNRYNLTIMGIAIKNNNIDIVRKLHSMGVDGEMYLVIAVKYFRHSIVEYFLDNTKTRIRIAVGDIAKDDEKMLYLLLKRAPLHGWDTFNYNDMVKKFGIGIPYIFIEKNNHAVIKFLLQKGMSPNVFIGDTHILDVAVNEMSGNVVDVLLKFGSIPQSQLTLEIIFSLGEQLFYDAYQKYQGNKELPIKRKIRNALEMEELIEKNLLPTIKVGNVPRIGEKMEWICNKYSELVGIDFLHEHSRVWFGIEESKEMYGYDSSLIIDNDGLKIISLSSDITTDATTICRALEYELVYLQMIENGYSHPSEYKYKYSRGGTYHHTQLFEIFGRFSHRGYKLFSPKPIFELQWRENSCYIDSLLVLLFFIRNSYWCECIFNFDETSILNTQWFKTTLESKCKISNVVDNVHTLKYLLYDLYSRLNEYMTDNKQIMCVNIREIIARCDDTMKDAQGKWIDYSGGQLYSILGLYFPTLGQIYIMDIVDNKLSFKIPPDYDERTIIYFNVDKVPYNEKIKTISLNQHTYELIGMQYLEYDDPMNHYTIYYYGYNDELYYYDDNVGVPEVVYNFPTSTTNGYPQLLFYELVR